MLLSCSVQDDSNHICNVFPRLSAEAIFIQDSIRRLLGLPGLSELLLSPRLGSLSTGLGVKDKVPPPEAAGVVSNKLLVVNIVVFGASPEGKNMVQRPGELVAAVGINGLEKTEHNPSVHCEDVEVLGDGTPEDGAADSSESKNHDLDRRSVLGSKTEGSRVLVVDLVDILVQEWDGVHGAVHPVVPCVFQDEEDGNLVGHGKEAREWYGSLEAEVLAHGVEEPDLRELDCEVGEEDEESALCLFPGGGNFVLLPVRLCCYSQRTFLIIPVGSCTS
jgi:hypothetical protein